MWVLEERRSRRSSEDHVAVRYQLEHTRERAGLHALVLADNDGLEVAGAGDRAIRAELSAMAPLIARCIMGVPLPPLLRGADVSVRAIELNGQPLYIASAGGGMARDAFLAQSMQGVKRILATN